MARKSHTHKYYKAQLPYGEVWACALPDCNHHMPQHYESLMNGKRSICWGCNEPMLLHAGNLDMKQPICDTCKLGVNKVNFDEVLRKIG
jgi:hypothetical protein